MHAPRLWEMLEYAIHLNFVLYIKYEDDKNENTCAEASNKGRNSCKTHRHPARKHDNLVSAILRGNCWALILIECG